jgi:hypothetical protein
VLSRLVGEADQRGGKQTVSFNLHLSVRPSNNRFERSRGRVFVGPRRESMIGIKCLHLTLVKPRVVQPHR